jgi:hypothetical protein
MGVCRAWVVHDDSAMPQGGQTTTVPHRAHSQILAAVNKTMSHRKSASIFWDIEVSFRQIMQNVGARPPTLLRMCIPQQV